MPTETSILTCIQSLKAQNLSGMINSAKSGSPVLSPKEDSRTSEEAGTTHLWWPFLHLWMLPSPEFGFPGGSVVKNLPANAGDTRDTGLIPESGRSPGEGNSNSLWYSCLENSMDRWAWRATVHGVMKSRTRLSAHTHTHIYIHTYTYTCMYTYTCTHTYTHTHIHTHRIQNGLVNPPIHPPPSLASPEKPPPVSSEHACWRESLPGLGYCSLLRILCGSWPKQSPT